MADKLDNEKDIKTKEKKQNEIIEKEYVFSENVLKVQKLINKIGLVILKENGFYNEETEQAIKKIQKITEYKPNGVIDQNLFFRLNEIIENPNAEDKTRTFAVRYKEYKDKMKENE